MALIGAIVVLQKGIINQPVVIMDINQDIHIAITIGIIMITTKPTIINYDKKTSDKRRNEKS